MIERLKKFVQRNPAAIVAGIFAVAFAVVMVGCQPTTTSPIDGTSVTAEQLDAQLDGERARLAAEAEAIAIETQGEIAAITAQAEGKIAQLAARSDAEGALLDAALAGVESKAQIAAADIEEKRERRAKFIEAMGTATTFVPPGYQQAATIGLGLLAVGLGVDNRRKDGVIKGQRIAGDGKK